METNAKQEVVARIPGRSVALAALFAVMLSAAGVTRAQSQSTVPKSMPAGAPASANATVNDNTTLKQAVTENASAEPATSAAQSVPKGQHEGLKVHGHWTIEVMKPDGTLDKHVEFENSLQQSGYGYLVGLVSGQFAAGAMQINVGGTPGPCSTDPGNAFIELAGGDCLIVPTTSTDPICTSALDAASPQGFCYSTLAESLTGATSGGPNGAIPFSALTITGKTYVDTTTSISSVATEPSFCYNNTGPTVGLTAESPNSCFSGITSTDFANGVRGNFTTLTSATLAVPISVIAGEVVVVTVVLSFS